MVAGDLTGMFVRTVLHNDQWTNEVIPGFLLIGVISGEVILQLWNAFLIIEVRVIFFKIFSSFILILYL